MEPETKMQSSPHFARMERPEMAGIVNWAMEPKLGIGERPLVRVLPTIWQMKARHECGERIDMIMDRQEEEPCAEGRCVLRKNGAKYKP